MAFRDMMPWKRRAEGGRKARPFEFMHDTVESMERFLDRPWALLSGTPQMDIEEKADEIVVTAKLPGLEREDLKIEVTESSLTLRASKARSQEQRRHGVLRRRRSSRSFVRHFTLPAPIRTPDVKASFRNGSLEIRLPRVEATQVRSVSEAAKPRTVEIE